ncbi:MAG TPA: SRPBCC family protein [Solirubrobacterales bacterium]|nr:SRPBCC family protein [Solirubrobacterales bacterium]
MARDVKDVSDLIGSTIGRIAREAAESVPQNGIGSRNGNGALSGVRGVAAGAALVAAAPFVAKGATKAVKSAVTKPAKDAKDASGEAGGGLLEGVKDKVGGGIKDTVAGGVKDAVGKKVDQAGGAAGIAKEAGKSAIPGVGGGGDEKGKKGTPGVGKGRRMPVQQAVDIGVPISTAYNQWTQFEEWPQFMHRLDQATQEDDCNVSFKTKLWGMSKEFEAQIVEQRPDERIMWTVTSGVTHTGVVTFHELADRLTRVQVTLDVEPGSLLEKAARGMRHVKRAVRADLARFKAFIEMQEVETGAWRGTIHDGELVEEHDTKYDKQREYAEFDDIYEREQSHSPDQVGAGSSSSGGSSTKSGGSSSSSKRGGSSSSSSRKRGGSSSSSSRKRGSSSSSSSRSRGGSSASGRSKSSSSGGRSRSGGSSRSSSGRKRSSSRS